MKINIPTPLRAFTDKQAVVEVSAATVQAGLDALITTHPELKNHLFTPEGKLRSFVNVYLGDDDVRYLPNAEGTEVKADDELTIIPSIAGGTSRRDLCCR